MKTLTKTIIALAILGMSINAFAEWKRTVKTDDFTKVSSYRLTSTDQNNEVNIIIYKSGKGDSPRLTLQSDSFDFLYFKNSDANVKFVDIVIGKHVYTDVGMNVGSPLSSLMPGSSSFVKEDKLNLIVNDQFIDQMRAGNILSIRLSDKIYKFSLMGFTKASNGM